MSNANPAHIVTGACRTSYCHLTQPKRNTNDGEPRYSVTLLLPKSDVATKQRIDAAIEAAMQRGVTEKWNGQRPPAPPIPVYDGDGVRPSDGSPFGNECKGHWVFTASGKQQPSIVDTNLQPILQPTEIYSGMYVRVGITFFPYFQAGKRGIGCALDNVQKMADGEQLAGNRMSAQDDFGQGAPAAPQAPAPVVNQPPLAAPAYQPPAYQPPAYQPQASAQYGYPAQQPPTYQPPVQPSYPAPVQPPQYDPITGQPMGGVYGL